MIETVSLGSIIDVLKGKKVKIIDKRTEDSVPYLLIDTLRGEEPKFFTEDKKYTEAVLSDILMVFDGANSGLSGTGLCGAVGSTIARLRPKKDVNTKYLTYFLDFNFLSLNQDIKGSAIPHVKPRKLLELKLRYPSKSEQELIVQEIEKQLSRLEESIKSLKSVKRKLEIYRKSVLKAAFGWNETIQLKGLCENFKSDIVDGPFGSDLQRRDYKKDGIPVLKIQNIKQNRIILKKMDYITENKYDELKRHSFKPGDIIMTKLGNPLGVCAIVPENLTKGVIVADLVRIRPSKINQNYLCYALNSPVTSQYINSKQKGTTRPRVKLSIVRELPIPIVAKNKQELIVQKIESRFSVIDKLEETVNQSLTKAEKLRKSILKSAFEGKLVEYGG